MHYRGIEHKSDATVLFVRCVSRPVDSHHISIIIQLESDAGRKTGEEWVGCIIVAEKDDLFGLRLPADLTIGTSLFRRIQ